MHLGVNSFVSSMADLSPGWGISPSERIRNLLEEIILADQVGLYSFGIEEHHRPDNYESAPTMILGAAAERTHRIRLGSAVALLSSADPVRLYEQFAALDDLAVGRTDLVVGPGSLAGAVPYSGLDEADDGSLFSEKLELLLKTRDNEEAARAE